MTTRSSLRSGETQQSESGRKRGVIELDSDVDDYDESGGNASTLGQRHLDGDILRSQSIFNFPLNFNYNKETARSNLIKKIKDKELLNFHKNSEDVQKQCIRAVTRLFLYKGRYSILFHIYHVILSSSSFFFKARDEK